MVQRLREVISQVVVVVDDVAQAVPSVLPSADCLGYENLIGLLVKFEDSFFVVLWIALV